MYDLPVTIARMNASYGDNGGLPAYHVDAVLAGRPISVRWDQYRYSLMHQDDINGQVEALLDAAHNPAGAWALAGYLKREFPEPLPIVFGALRDKDVTMMLKALLPAASRMVMTEPDTPRAHRADELAAIARGLSPDATIETEPDPALALERAWSHCPVVCAAGSIFLVGNLLAAIGAEARDL